MNVSAWYAVDVWLKSDACRQIGLIEWRSGNVVGHISEVTVHRARLVLYWDRWPFAGIAYVLVCNQQLIQISLRPQVGQEMSTPPRFPLVGCILFPKTATTVTPIANRNHKAPQGGWRSSPPACTASLIFWSSKAPWLWPWPWIGSRLYQHAQYL